MLNLSVLDLVPVLPGAGPAGALMQARLLAQTAEKLGYKRYWAAEHHDMERLACTAPEVLLAHVGACTNRIRLGSGALLLPNYRPLKVAETFHMLAALYPGRIDLGIGRAPGGSAHVSMALCENFLESVRRYPEALRDLSRLLLHQFQLEGEPVRARPIPPEPPELWLLGTNRKSAAYAAELGAGYVFGQFMGEAAGPESAAAYRRRFRPSPHFAAPRLIVAVGVVCAETDEAAERLAGIAFAHAQEQNGESAGTGESAGERQSAEAEEGKGNSGGSGRVRQEPDADSTPLWSRRWLIGGPARVREQLLELSRIYGTEEFLIVTPGPDYDNRLRSYRLLAEALQLDAAAEGCPKKGDPSD